MKRTVLNAIDRPEVWEKALRGKRYGLITNPSGVDRSLRLSADLLYEFGGLVCLFSPEHGVRGDRQAGAAVSTYTDDRTGLPVYSMYGSGHHIPAEVLSTLDSVVFDIQDVGARFYTYIYTLSYAMEDCAAAGKEMIVFDRLNPLGGGQPQGTVLKREFSSSIGRFPIATRFGLTVGEYARFINETEGIGCALTVIPIEGWSRTCLFSDTDLPWVSPSPNLPTVDSAILYIGTCLFEGTNLSEGRGTTHPFEMIGAPWIDADALASEMRAMGLPGVLFRPCHFIPTFSKYAGELCHGVQLHVTDHRALRPFECGLLLLEQIRNTYREFDFRPPNANGRYFIDLLLGRDELRHQPFSASEFLSAQETELCEYRKRIQPYYLYD